MNNLIRRLPKTHSILKEIIKKNYQNINLDNLKAFTLKSNKTKQQKFYIQVIQDILSSNPESLELLKNLVVLNPNLETNIDRALIESSFKSKTIRKSFNDLVNKGIIREKQGKEGLFELTSLHLQDALSTLASEENHRLAMQYYTVKINKYGENLTDEIELLFHKVKIKPNEQLVNEFLSISQSLQEIDNKFRRLIDIAEELINLDNKYKAPIFVVLGNLYSATGNSEEAEKAYLNALNTYKTLAQQYYKIYLPYIAAIEKNLGTLYVDLKRFEEAEKIYLDALKTYSELEKQYYDVYSPEIDSTQNDIAYGKTVGEQSYLDEFDAYNQLMKQYYDVYLPDKTSIQNYFGNVCIDLDLLEDIQDGEIDSPDSYKKLAKMCYDMSLTDVATTQSNLGATYFEEGKIEAAEKMYLESLNIRKKLAEIYPENILPDLAFNFVDLGDLYAHQNKFKDAELMYDEGLKISKRLAENNPEVYLYNVAIIQNCLGTVFIKLQKLKEAEIIYLEALEIFKKFAKEDPKTYSYDVAIVQNNLGNLFIVLEKYEKANYYLNKAIKADPSNIDILYNKACLEALRNNQIQALELLAFVIKSDESYKERILKDKRFDSIKELKEFKDLIGN
ncbi:MAG: tetratricopeptide repeat protein [Promethearchaeota archaeon]